MDAKKPSLLVDQLQLLSGDGSPEFREFIKDLIDSSQIEVNTLDDLRVVIAQYLQKEMGQIASSDH